MLKVYIYVWFYMMATATDQKMTFLFGLRGYRYYHSMWSIKQTSLCTS